MEELERLTLVKGKFKLKRKEVNAIPLKLAVAKLSYPEYLGLSGYSLKKKLRKNKQKDSGGLRLLMNYDLEHIVGKKPKKANAYIIGGEPNIENVRVPDGLSGLGAYRNIDVRTFPVLYLKIKEGNGK